MLLSIALPLLAAPTMELPAADFQALQSFEPACMDGSASRQDFGAGEAARAELPLPHRPGHVTVTPFVSDYRHQGRHRLSPSTLPVVFEPDDADGQECESSRAIVTKGMLSLYTPDDYWLYDRFGCEAPNCSAAGENHPCACEIAAAAADHAGHSDARALADGFAAIQLSFRNESEIAKLNKPEAGS